MAMRRIEAESALYIKLGRGGDWEDNCISQGTLRFGYREISHDACKRSDWKAVLQERESSKGNRSVAKSDVTQIGYFYESSRKVLWVTFYKHALWWCFADEEVTLLHDGTKVRRAIGGWKQIDRKGNLLSMSTLSGKLLSMQGYRGTICRVKETPYLRQRLNAEEAHEVVQARQSLEALHTSLEAVIRHLSWKDFELLIDLIFRQVGWRRVGAIGSTTKSLDLDLLSPVSAERYGVQVKAKATRKTFERYRDDRLTNMQGFAKCYFVVHTLEDGLASVVTGQDDDVRLLLPADVARLTAVYGLSEWVLDKAG